MTESRVAGRLRVLPRALANRLFPRRRPAQPKRVLIAHHLLLGDVMMLAPLLAKLRERYPQAEVAMTVRRALVPLFARRPYGVQAIPYDPRDSSTLDRLFDEKPFDLALTPGDNRYSWLAAAAPCCCNSAMTSGLVTFAYCWACWALGSVNESSVKAGNASPVAMPFTHSAMAWWPTAM